MEYNIPSGPFSDYLTFENPLEGKVVLTKAFELINQINIINIINRINIINIIIIINIIRWSSPRLSTSRSCSYSQ